MNESEQLRTLAVDIGGSGIKVMVLDTEGNPLSDRQRLKTPNPATPEKVIDVILTLAKEQEYDRISVGFPGVVQNGVIKTAVNLHDDWLQYDLATSLSQLLSRPVKVANDADIQGLGAISGNGVELVITLGTGFGSALFVQGKLVPNLEMGHHPFRKRETYEEQLGRAALDKHGARKWNLRLEKAIACLDHLFNYDTLYIGGGETKQIKLDLPASAKIIPNVTGLLGGIKLWTN
ncbi:chromosome partitioning protein ParA [Pleurocapsa sp. CCALA 161]|uniref:ROK family protein n=1 Tax=Pleurocapsa sp. CCALA 161 TaxID=2107688 RepID=UPI000D085512|nr:ROK family protein [Pleurocapsa sp. CCALA 161]PSB12630.1 chromosome partitioning protein ParA [Pleurocapsa sp. CCALA 161]